MKLTLAMSNVQKLLTVLTHAGVENKLLIEHAQLITQFESEVDDYPEHVCCSCECLCQRKSVTKVKLSDKLGNAVWPRQKEFILGQCPNTNEVGTMYMCNYCKSSIKNNKLPPRCVLNGLEPRDLAFFFLLLLILLSSVDLAR